MRFSCRTGLFLATALAIAAPTTAADSIEAFGKKWTVPIASDWKVDGDVLRLTVPRPSEKPRRPTQFALAETPPLSRVTLEADVKRQEGKGMSLILVYAYRDADHFNYAHLSSDLPSAVAYHNGIFHVYGGDRVRISSVDGPAALPDTAWHRVRLNYDAKTGVATVAVDGTELPSLKAADYSLGAGKVGIGSFFNTADFRNIRITGE